MGPREGTGAPTGPGIASGGAAPWGIGEGVAGVGSTLADGIGAAAAGGATIGAVNEEKSPLGCGVCCGIADRLGEFILPRTYVRGTRLRLVVPHRRGRGYPISPSLSNPRS